MQKPDTKRIALTLVQPITQMLGIPTPKHQINANSHPAAMLANIQHPPSDYQRRYDIDWLRAINVLLVFLFHTTQPFSYNESWPIHSSDDKKEQWLDALIVPMDVWSMPLLMALSGATTFYSLRRRTKGEFVRGQIERNALPCLAGILLLCPTQSYFRRLSQGEFDGSLLEFYPHFFDGIYPEGNLSYYHLWFLAYLFAYSVVGLPLFHLLETQEGRKWVDRLATLSQKPGALLLLVLPFIAGQVALRGQFPKSYFILNDWAFHALLFPSFVMGYILVTNSKFEQAIEQTWKPALAIALSSFAILYVAEWRSMSLGYSLKWALSATSSWTMIVATLGIGKRFLNTKKPVLPYIQQATRPFYIVHQSVIVAIAYAVVQRNIPLLAKLLAINIASFAATMGIYETAKRWSITQRLFGMK